jgi:PIN domain nuclease of toxin-antitoxin system
MMIRVCQQAAAASGDQIGFSTITLVEAVYLMEKGHILPDTFTQLLAAVEQPGAVLLELPLNRAITAAMTLVNRRLVPDMPDRIIAATAQFYSVPLISRDRQIKASGLSVIW